MKRLLLLGGGHAHVHVLHELAARPLPDTEVTLVTPFARQMYGGMVPGLIAGHYDTPACTIPLSPLATAARVTLVQASAVALDAEQRRVSLSNGQQAEYELLSINTGVVMDRDALPGARQHALFVRPVEHFVPLFERVLALAQERVLDVVVIGADAVGVELAMAMQCRLGERARVALVIGGATPLDGHAPRIIERALAQLRRWRITLLPEACVVVQADHLKLASGVRVACDVPLLASGSVAPAWLQGSGLALDERGCVATLATLQSSSHPQVLALGDVATGMDRRPGDRRYPRSGADAVRAGPALVHNLRALLAGEAPLPHLPPTRTLDLISCGSKVAIGSWGDVSAQGRWVWWCKDAIDRALVRRYAAPYLSAHSSR